MVSATKLDKTEKLGITLPICYRKLKISVAVFPAAFIFHTPWL